LQLARQRDKSSPRPLLFWRACIHDNDHQNFLVYVNPRDLHRFLLRGSGRTHDEKGYAPSRATTPPRMGGATQIGSKRAFLIKLKNGLTSSRV